MRKSAAIARIAIFFAVMLTIHFVTSFILRICPVWYSTDLGSYSCRDRFQSSTDLELGAILGLLMGLFSLTMNTLVITPASYLFSPFVLTGNLYSLIIAIVPSDSHWGNPLLRLSLDYAIVQDLVISWNCRLYDQYHFCFKREFTIFFGNSLWW